MKMKNIALLLWDIIIEVATDKIEEIIRNKIGVTFK